MLFRSPFLSYVALAAGVSVGCGGPTDELTEVAEALNGGRAANVGELPAVGTIPGCTATLIDSDVVLTAAHCVCQDGQVGKPLGGRCQTRSKFTMHGVYPVDDPATAVNESAVRKDITIDGDVHPHPSFESVRWMSSDYAIIKLDKKAHTVAKGVLPMTVTPATHAPKKGDTLTMVGYGKTGNACKQGGTGKKLLSLSVNDASAGGIKFVATNQHVCPGDSGGPVLNAQDEVAGVASWGNFSTDSTYRPTYPVRPWILGYMQDKQGPTCATASALGPTGDVAAAIDYPGDVDVYSIEVPIAGRLTAQANSSYSTDTFGELKSSSCSTLQQDDDGGVGSGFLLDRQVSAGTYFILVRHYDQTDGLGAYGMNVIFTPGADDHGNTGNDATCLAIAGNDSGAIEYGGDVDFFELNVTGAGELRVWTTGNTDTYGILYGAGNIGILQESDDDGAGRNFELRRAVSPGTYYVAVRHYSSSGQGAYSVHVSLSSGDDHGDACSSATALAAMAAEDGSIGHAGDVDVFRVQLPSARSLKVYSSGQTDTFGTLLDAGCNELDTDDDGGASRNFRIQRVVPAGTYYVAVRHYSASQTGDYRLYVNPIE